MERNRCADLLRVAAIGAVLLGHWLLVDITYRSGHLVGRNALLYVDWGRWLTLLLQVMPVFFVVGGFANAVSWTAHRAHGGNWTDWLRRRALRLLWPTTLYVAVAASSVTAARLAGADSADTARAGWLAALHLWFLPVYLLLIALTPPLLAAHRRWGLAVPAVMAAGAAAVDVAVLGPGIPVIGFANYPLVWGAMHQWGFAWQDGTLTRPRWRCGVLAVAGAAALVALVGLGPFPVDMVGAGLRVANTAPPSIALLAFAAAQTGLLLLAEPALQRMSTRPALWRLVHRLNPMVMTAYLWQMVPVIVVAVALYPTGAMPRPGIGSARWWELRPVWLALLAVVLVPVVLAVTRAQRPLRRLPAGFGATGWWSPALLVCGVGAVAVCLARLAIAGFAPAGRLPVTVLAAYLCGLTATLFSGRPSPVEPLPATGA